MSISPAEWIFVYICWAVVCFYFWRDGEWWRKQYEEASEARHQLLLQVMELRLHEPRTTEPNRDDG